MRYGPPWAARLRSFISSFNPFDYNAYKNWIDSLSNEANNVRSTWEEDSDGAITQRAKFHLSPTRSVPLGNTYDYPLSEWEASHGGTTRYLRLVLDASQEITEDGLDTYLPVEALLTWLRGHQTSTEEQVGTDATDFETFRYTDPGGANNIEFAYTHARGRTDFYVGGIAHQQPGGNVVYLSYALLPLAGSPVALTGEEWNEVLASETITLNVAASGVEVEHNLGAVDAGVRGNALESGSSKLMLRNSEVDHKVGNLTYTLGPSFGAVSPHTELETNSSSQYLLPRSMHHDTIHFAELTADVVLRCESADDLLSHDNTHRRYAVHHTGTVQVVTIRDSADEKLLDLQPGEFCTFIIVRSPSVDPLVATGNELIFEHTPTRTLRARKSNPETLTNFPEFSDPAESGSGTLYFIDFRTGSGPQDVMTRFTTPYSSPPADGADIAQLQNNVRGVVRFNRPGNLRVYGRMRIAAKSTATGSMHSGHGLWGYRRRGSTLGRILILSGDAIDPSDSSDMFGDSTFDIQKDDTVFGFWKERTDRTLSDSELELQYHEMTFVFDPFIRVGE